MRPLFISFKARSIPAWGIGSGALRSFVNVKFSRFILLLSIINRGYLNFGTYAPKLTTYTPWACRRATRSGFDMLSHRFIQMDA